MTRKDYHKIAKVIKDLNHLHKERERVAKAFGEMLEEDNPRFDLQRFITACMGLPNEDGKSQNKL